MLRHLVNSLAFSLVLYTPPPATFSLAPTARAAAARPVHTHPMHAHTRGYPRPSARILIVAVVPLPETARGAVAVVHDDDAVAPPHRARIPQQKIDEPSASAGRGVDLPARWRNRRPAC